MKKNVQFLVLFVFLSAFLLGGCTFFRQYTGVLIGTNLALSGKGMSYSASTERGIELAKDIVNERGGLLGKPVQLVSVDNHGKPEDAVAAIQQLNVRHVSAIIGPDLADCTRAVIPNVEASRFPSSVLAGRSPISPSISGLMKSISICSGLPLSTPLKGVPWPIMPVITCRPARPPSLLSR